MHRTFRSCRRGARLLILLAMAAMAYGCTDSRPLRALRIASGSTSMTLCTAAFVSGFDPDHAYRLEVEPAPGMAWVDWALKYTVDRNRQEVRSSIGGVFGTRALYRHSLGCVLALRSVPTEGWKSSGATPTPSDPFPVLASENTITAESLPLRAAIDAAFVETDEPARNTLAVVVVQHGHLLGERYSVGVGPTTPLPGHSLSKSFTHALVGVLARRGRIDADAPLSLPGWPASDDQRRRITANHLLAMDSGLPWDEYHGGFDPATRMWFDEADPYGYAAKMPLAYPPGTHWGYSNLGYAVLSRLVRDRTGGTAATTAEWIQQELLDPMHMQHTVVTFDATGTPMGANGVVASARDWARLGLLYLNGGKLNGGTLLPAGWVDQARIPTLDAGYGRGFWLNNTHAAHPLPGHWGMPGAPAETYFGRGYLGQFVVIVPSADLVIVRLGISYRPGGDIATVGRLVGDVVAASTPRSATYK